jgi:hypothetical protein
MRIKKVGKGCKENAYARTCKNSLPQIEGTRIF